MRIKNILVYAFFIISSTLEASALSEWYNNLNSTLSGIPTTATLTENFAEAVFAKSQATEQFNIRLGHKCFLKNKPTEGPRSSLTTEQVRNFNTRHILFWGDSMTDWIDIIPKKFQFPLVGEQQYDIQVDPHIYYGSNWDLIQNEAIGGTTSEDLRRHFDSKGGANPSLFYPNPVSDNHINLENRYAVILYGGNDLKRFEPILKALPFLVIFRNNAVVNNINRIVTYHQAQGAKVLLVGHTPRPSSPNFNFFGDLGIFKDFMDSVLGHFLEELTYALTLPGQIYNDIASCINQGICFLPPNVRETSAASIYAGAREREAEKFLATALNYSAAKRTDSTWISQQLGYQTLMLRNFVVLVRNIEYLDEWVAFSEPTELLAGRWWAGNPTLYDGDSIHFSHPWGHALHASNVSSKLSQLGWWQNPIPEQGDRCNFTNSATFPTGQPAGWTPEPPELPEANEDTIALILLCFMFGICSF